MRTITARAPIRICDCGGWTDTWFARYGRVFNIAIQPRVEVRIDVFPAGGGRPPVVLDVADFGERFAPSLSARRWERHPLLEAAVASVGIPEGTSVEIRLSSGVPAGAATGTSAAVTVALLGALRRLNGLPLDPYDVARAAHAVETDLLDQQSGIQDQLCSAFGGINDITMTAYPDAVVRPLSTNTDFCGALERRLSVVLLGGGHRSSDLHEAVIERLEGLGPDCNELDAIRRCAAGAIRAFEAEDLAALGAAMSANTDAQRRLHPDLVCRDAERVVAIARDSGALGWKVNGAGGVGGSLTILGPESADAASALHAAVCQALPAARVLRPTLDLDGLAVFEAEDAGDRN